MKLGLDLRGGVHFLMEIDMNEAMRKILDGMKDTIRSSLREERIRYTNVSVEDNAINVELRSDEDFQQAEQYLDGRYQGYQMVVDAETNTVNHANDRAKTRGNA